MAPKPSLVMKNHLIINLLKAGTLGFSLVTLLSSCGSSPQPHPKDLHQRQMQAHAMRAQVHREEVARQFAPLPEPKVSELPNQVRYYEVPVEGHVNSDGLIIESHKLTLEIVQ